MRSISETRSTPFQNSGNVFRWTAPSGRGSVRNVFLSRDQRERSGQLYENTRPYLGNRVLS